MTNQRPAHEVEMGVCFAHAAVPYRSRPRSCSTTTAPQVLPAASFSGRWPLSRGCGAERNRLTLHSSWHVSRVISQQSATRTVQSLSQVVSLPTLRRPSEAGEIRESTNGRPSGPKVSLRRWKQDFGSPYSQRRVKSRSVTDSGFARPRVLAISMGFARMNCLLL